MRVEEVIKKAVEGGWTTPETPASLIVGHYLNVAPIKAHPLEIANQYHELAFLDPSFWQSLGKALGWGHTLCRSCGRLGKHIENWESARWPWIKCCDGQNMDHHPSPIWYWHRFIDSLMEGKSAEDFFEKVN